MFYKQGLSSFPESDFTDAGFSTQYYDNLKYIAHDEESHVVALTAALSAAGASPVAACVYDFPFTDAKSFVTLASVLEGYAGALESTLALLANVILVLVYQHILELPASSRAKSTLA